MVIDEEASQALVNWADERDYYVQQVGANVPIRPPPSRDVPLELRSGVCPRYGADLGSFPTSEWRGLIVRPVELPSGDPSGFAVSGPNADGLCGDSPVASGMLDRLPEYMRSVGRTTYFDYFLLKYGSTVRMVQETRGVDSSMPLVTATRISRHRNAANVSVDEMRWDLD